MTKKEVLKILAVLKEVGVQFVGDTNNVLVEVWTKAFSNDTYDNVSRAVFELVELGAPLYLNGLIGKIKERIVLNSNDFMDFEQAWALITKAMHKTHPDISQETQNAFNSLPPMLQYLIQTPRHLEDMEYCLDRNVLETVEKSNLRKSYQELVSRTKQEMMLGYVPKWQLELVNRKYVDAIENTKGEVINLKQVVKSF